jgi:hypothetical protein
MAMNSPGPVLVRSQVQIRNLPDSDHRSPDSIELYAIANWTFREANAHAW